MIANVKPSRRRSSGTRQMFISAPIRPRRPRSLSVGGRLVALGDGLRGLVIVVVVVGTTGSSAGSAAARASAAARLTSSRTGASRGVLAADQRRRVPPAASIFWRAQAEKRCACTVSATLDLAVAEDLDRVAQRAQHARGQQRLGRDLGAGLEARGQRARRSRRACSVRNGPDRHRVLRVRAAQLAGPACAAASGRR